ncbi:DUF2931 family protein [Chryseobacterium oryctis]|uniref:DUF2931 family protein n=1 Tax=Chryseobacterium oryctis TaxID=2952618 RepID=A0ABT3HL65_9FLAO|nr:DUF2931 family protein [Chryseobacterium oryctis]MCW3160532.1 DUF2931 family protein [Chryseobacterium oryctis]
MISLSVLLFSCQKTKYPWQPGISAPKYYPIADVFVDFKNGRNGSRITFDNGWGNSYGSVVSGNRYKDIPNEVFIHYNSAVENFVYKGTVNIPKEKVLRLFNQYDIEKNNSADLIVGMAPGGWIRVWFHTIDRKTDKIVNVEITKVKLRGNYDDSTDNRYKIKNLENWGKYYIYWQHFGIPYEAWAENEKEYDLVFDFKKPNNRRVSFGYVSLDGTFYQRTIERGHQKLPSEIEMCWLDDKNNDYCCKILMPKNFKKYIEQKNLKQVNLRLEIEKDHEHATLYLVNDNKKEKIVRFKSSQPTEKEIKDIEYAYAQNVEYFI